jgi:hypothetical protein
MEFGESKFQTLMKKSLSQHRHHDSIRTAVGKRTLTGFRERDDMIATQTELHIYAYVYNRAHRRRLSNLGLLRETR